MFLSNHCNHTEYSHFFKTGYMSLHFFIITFKPNSHDVQTVRLWYFNNKLFLFSLTIQLNICYLMLYYIIFVLLSFFYDVWWNRCAMEKWFQEDIEYALRYSLISFEQFIRTKYIFLNTCDTFLSLCRIHLSAVH